MGRVFVAGSINMDVVAMADRHPRIGETVAGTAVLYFPGGKGANQAVAAAKLGAATTLICRLGKDAFGDELKAFLAAQRVDLTFVQDTAEAHTGTAISAFFKRARAAGATTILNPAPAIEFSRELVDLVDILILNETELGFLTKTELRDTDDYPRFIEAARSLQISKDKIICVTLGKRGIVALIDGQPHTDLGRAVKAVDTTGAGDCFVGAVAALLADGQPVRSAFGYANIAASICVQRMGVAPSMPTAAEVE